MNASRDRPPGAGVAKLLHGSSAPQLRCPEGRNCRLTLVNARERLVYCVLLEDGVCPNVMSFEGTRYCRAFIHAEPVRRTDRGMNA